MDEGGDEDGGAGGQLAVEGAEALGAAHEVGAPLDPSVDAEAVGVGVGGDGPALGVDDGGGLGGAQVGAGGRGWGDFGTFFFHGS